MLQRKFEKERRCGNTNALQFGTRANSACALPAAGELNLNNFELCFIDMFTAARATASATTYAAKATVLVAENTVHNTKVAAEAGCEALSEQIPRNRALRRFNESDHLTDDPATPLLDHQTQRIISPLFLSFPSTGSTFPVDEVLFLERFKGFGGIVAFVVSFFGMVVIPFWPGSLYIPKGQEGCEVAFLINAFVSMFSLISLFAFFLIYWYRAGPPINWMPESTISLVVLLEGSIAQHPWVAIDVLQKDACSSASNWTGMEYFDPSKAGKYSFNPLDSNGDIDDYFFHHQIIMSVSLFPAILFVKLYSIDPSKHGNSYPNLLYYGVLASVLITINLLSIPGTGIQSIGQGDKTVSILILMGLIAYFVHMSYSAYGSLMKMRYMRTRWRQIGFFVLLVPLTAFTVFRYASLLSGIPVKYSVCSFWQTFLVWPMYGLFSSVCCIPAQNQQSKCDDISNHTLKQLGVPVRIYRREEGIYDRGDGLENPVSGAMEETDAWSPARQLVSLSLETTVWAYNATYLVYFDQPSSKRPSSISDTSGARPNEISTEALKSACLRVHTWCYDEETDTTACIFTDRKRPWRIFVAFRGTSSAKNASTDLKVNQQWFRVGGDSGTDFRIHYGFVRAWTKVKNPVCSGLEQAIEHARTRFPKCKICICATGQVKFCGNPASRVGVMLLS